jgi:hypothetical protein
MLGLRLLIITVPVPVVYTLYGAGRNGFYADNPFRGPLAGMGPEIETFLGPEMATSEAFVRNN